MAAREDEPQPASSTLSLSQTSRSTEEIRLRLFVEGIEPGLPADAVDPSEPPCRNQPRPWIRGNSIAGPGLQSGPERVMKRLFGQVEAAEKPDQRREDAAGLLAIDDVDQLSNVLSSFSEKTRTYG